MPDDRVPEEGQQTYLPLLTALHSAAQQRQPITAAEQAGILARVRDRLADATNAASTSLAPTVNAPPPSRLLPPSVPVPQATHSPRWGLRLLAAVAVLLLIVGSSWAFLRVHSFTSGAASATPTPEPAPSAHAQAGGLEASMRVLVDGPYFLSELLPVDLSLTNHSPDALGFFGLHTTATLCHSSALMVRITAGSDPSFDFHGPGEACLQDAPFTTIQPGETLTIHQYLPLTKSGLVTLTMQSGWDAKPSDALPSALDGHWPSVQIHVNTQVPQNRTLAIGILLSLPEKVVVQTPEGEHPHLLYMQAVVCTPLDDSSKGGFSAGNDFWEPFSSGVLVEPTCPSGQLHWNYVFSAPGYTIVSSSQ